MSVKIKPNKKMLDEIAKTAVLNYAKAHNRECAYCHRPVMPSAGIQPDQLPVCENCAEEHNLI